MAIAEMIVIEADEDIVYDFEKFFNQPPLQMNSWVDRRGVMYEVSQCGHSDWAFDHQTDAKGGFALERAGWLHISQGSVYYSPDEPDCFRKTKFSRPQQEIVEMYCEATNTKLSRFDHYL